MPSQVHAALLLLFRNRPHLAPELLRDALHVELPPYTEARIESADLTDVQPAEYRADLVVLLYDGNPVLGIVVEAQLTPDDHKRFAWPVYAVGLRARMRCPVCLLVVSPHDAVVRWASKPSLGLDAERSRLYFDLVVTSLSEAARKSLHAMDPAKYEYQSEFAKRYIALGKAEGQAEGRAEGEVHGRAAVLIKLLTLKFGPLTTATTDCVQQASAEELDRWAERILSATSLDEVLG